MKSIFLACGKAMLLWLLVTAMVGVATLWQWEKQQVDPDEYQIFLYLLGVPTAFTAGMLFLLWQAKKIKSAIQGLNRPDAGQDPEKKSN